MKVYLLFVLVFLVSCISSNLKPSSSGENVSVVEHPSKLFSFPYKVGEYVRVSTEVYDSNGTNMSATYTPKTDKSVVITIYAFRAPPLSNGTISNLVQHFSAEEQGIINSAPGTKKQNWPQNIPMWSDEGVPGVLSAYDLGGAGEVVSLIQLYDYGLWRLKFRTSYKSRNSKIAESHVDKFHNLFTWPK